MTRLLARWRVFLGFVFAAIVVWLATPTPRSLVIGAAIAIAGESIRVWAAGHLEKSKEVTQSGPYRYTRHPLYLGSSLIGIGMAIAANNVIVFVIVIAYLALTLTAAMRSEEAHLREKFGDAYDAYAEKRARTNDPAIQLGPCGRQSRASHHRRTLVGIVAACRENDACREAVIASGRLIV